MAESAYVADVTRADFREQVLERSRDMPVLVDFWAAWCGPCRVLTPTLARLAEDYGGRFFLAKVDTDAQRELAMEYGIRSLPTLKLFRNATPAGELIGVQPDAVIRALIDRHLPSEADAQVQQAQALYAAGQTAQALSLLRTAVAADAKNDRPKLELARALLALPLSEDTGVRAAEVANLLDSLSVGRLGDPELARLRAHLDLLRVLVNAPPLHEVERAVASNPADSEARYQLGAYRALARDYEPALQSLLEIVRRDRKFQDDGARKAMVDLFTVLGNDDPLVGKYRGLLSKALN